MSVGDPTDDALEAIADLEKPETSDERDGASDRPGFFLVEEILTTSPAASDSYTKFGPGPLTAVRFKWTTRRDDNGDYFVDETIGESSYPLVSGPMTKEAAIEFVDDRELNARQRFEALRSEMAGGEIGQRADE